VKLLHVTDTHLGAIRAVRGGPRGWSRAADHQAALEAALALAEVEDVDLVLHSGDLFDRSRPPRKAMVLAAETLLEAARRRRVVLMPGNHDRRGLRRWLPHASLEVHDRPARVEVGGVILGLVPFVREAEAFAGEAAALAAGGIDLLVAHQAFDGARVPGLVFRAGAQRDTIGEAHLPASVRHVLCGHLHPRQVTRVGGAEVVQPGSTERTSWSERTQAKGVALWELGAGVTWRFVDLPSRPMIDVDGPGDLTRVVPGALVRARGVPEEEVLARGGWLDGPPAPVVASIPRPRPPEPPRPQLGLFGNCAVSPSPPHS
jgi:DNA repair exonuclease SbcCD nuclease subunit